MKDDDEIGQSNSTSDDEYVGYGHPPKNTRFRPGQSGNPKGRKRGSKNRKTIVEEIANEQHKIDEDGRSCRRTTLELIVIALRNLAVEGDPRASRLFRKFSSKYQPQQENTAGGVLVVPGPRTPEELGIVVEDVEEDEDDLRTPFRWGDIEKPKSGGFDF